MTLSTSVCRCWRATSSYRTCESLSALYSEIAAIVCRRPVIVTQNLECINRRIARVSVHTAPVQTVHSPLTAVPANTLFTVFDASTFCDRLRLFPSLLRQGQSRRAACHTTAVFLSGVYLVPQEPRNRRGSCSLPVAINTRLNQLCLETLSPQARRLFERSLLP